MTDTAILRAIESADPDGWSHREPMDADYDQFKAWAVKTYGWAAWAEYTKGGWDENGQDWL